MSILNMNAESYRKFTQAKQPVMVEFSAPWCVYCRRLAPALESVAEEYRDTLVLEVLLSLMEKYTVALLLRQVSILVFQQRFFLASMIRQRCGQE